MPVKEQKQTKEEKQEQQREVQEKEDKLGDDLLSSLDLSSDEEETKLQDDSFEEGGEVDLRRDLNEKEPEVEEEEEETEEEVIPVSKHKKRIDALTAKNKILEEQLNEAKAKSSSEGTRKDKLENMSQQELKQLKQNARSEWKRTDDPEREAQLDELMDEIDDVMSSVPKRFQQKQEKAFNQAVQEIITDPKNEEIDFDKEGVEIRKIAEQVYSSYPDLKSLEKGQALALKMAVDHYKATREVSKIKSKEGDLKRQNTNLKRKTALDSSAVKGNAKRANLKELREKAKRGDYLDKENYLTEILDVDRYLPPELRERG